MQSVEYVHGWWVLRACGRNPLVRGIDRLELLIVALGILVLLLATACAGALGTAVHDARSRVYIAQAQSRHTVIARPIDDSFALDGSVKTEESPTIWVDRAGNRVGAPTPTSQAGVDAVIVASVAWQTVALVVAGLVWWGHSRLERRRDSAWEREIRWLIHDDSGRKP